ncbi:hypothetical protein [Longitalea arenae]|uniref:hypothetical protein n=1 Tax=Longitalea arenae TaxID=2812558 RepID=UPI001967FFE3|nr:hypothetical protein [Longitalea arenae]
MIKRNNVLSWELTGDRLIYTDEINKQFCIETLSTGAIEKHPVDFSPTFFYHIPGNRLVLVDDVYEPLSIYTGSSVEPLDMRAIGGILVQEQDPRYFVFFDNSNFEAQKYKVFDWSENKVKLESERPFFIVQDNALTILNGVLHCYTLNGELRWQYKPAAADPQLDHEDPTKIIGIYNNELWMQPDKKTLTVLDARTGKPIIAHFNIQEQLALPYFSIGEAYLDEQKGRIRILAYSRYVEIDLASHTATIRKQHDAGWSIGVGRFYHGDARAYFTADYPLHGKVIGNITAGIFNTETLEIEWYHSLPADNKNHFFTGQPQASEKYVGVKDSNDTLHLFER